MKRRALSYLGYNLAISWHDLKNRPSPSFIIFALWTHVTFLRWVFTAKSNANFAILWLLVAVTIFKHSMTPFTDSCSKAEYSPSVCSRIITQSTLLWRDFTPGKDFTCTTFEYKSKLFRNFIFNVCNSPVDEWSGVAKIP